MSREAYVEEGVDQDGGRRYFVFLNEGLHTRRTLHSSATLEDANTYAQAYNTDGSLSEITVPPDATRADCHLVARKMDGSGWMLLRRQNGHTTVVTSVSNIRLWDALRSAHDRNIVDGFHPRYRVMPSEDGSRSFEVHEMWGHDRVDSSFGFDNEESPSLWTGTKLAFSLALARANDMNAGTVGSIDAVEQHVRAVFGDPDTTTTPEDLGAALFPPTEPARNAPAWGESRVISAMAHAARVANLPTTDPRGVADLIDSTIASVGTQLAARNEARLGEHFFVRQDNEDGAWNVMHAYGSVPSDLERVKKFATKALALQVSNQMNIELSEKGDMTAMRKPPEDEDLDAIDSAVAEANIREKIKDRLIESLSTELELTTKKLLATEGTIKMLYANAIKLKDARDLMNEKKDHLQCCIRELTAALERVGIREREIDAAIAKAQKEIDEAAVDYDEVSMLLSENEKGES